MNYRLVFIALIFIPLFLSQPVAAAAKHGNGEPVLILPGFMAGDGSTRPLRAFLRSHDWMACRWRMGRAGTGSIQ